MSRRPEHNIFDAILNRLQSIEGRVMQLQMARDFSMPVYNLTTDPPSDPFDGMYAINKEDNEPYYYYNNVWTKFCA